MIIRVRPFAEEPQPNKINKIKNVEIFVAFLFVDFGDKKAAEYNMLQGGARQKKFASETKTNSCIKRAKPCKSTDNTQNE